MLPSANGKNAHGQHQPTGRQPLNSRRVNFLDLANDGEQEPEEPNISIDSIMDTFLMNFHNLSPDDRSLAHKGLIEFLVEHIVDNASKTLLPILANVTQHRVPLKQKRSWTKPLASALPPCDICKVLQNPKSSQGRYSASTTFVSSTADGVTCSILATRQGNQNNLLVDCCTNGGVCDNGVWVIKVLEQWVHVEGITDHSIPDIRPIITAGGVIESNRSPVIAILHQYAKLGKGPTIHSAGQLEWYWCNVNAKSVKVNR